MSIATLAILLYKHRMAKLARWLISLFIVAIFIGDVWLEKLTLPLSMLLIPFIFLTGPWRTLRSPLGAYFLLGMLIVVAVQVALHLSTHWKSDFSVWSPIVFAAATIFCLHGRTELSSEFALKSMYAGGVATGAIMVAMVMFAPVGAFLIPGQNAYAVDESGPGWQAPRSSSKSMTVVNSPSIALSEDAKAFYGLKNRAKNMLGLSNYISAFFVFLFAVALFSGHPWVAVVMAAFVAVTLSRFGIAFMVTIGGGYFAYRRGVRVTTVVACIAAATIAGFLALNLFGNYIGRLPGAESIQARIDLWKTGVVPIATRPLLGAQRSLIIEEQGYSIIWQPHNSLIWIAANFGFIGLGLYVCYIGLVLRTIAKAARKSSQWAGTLVGVTTLLAWSMVEIIVLTPAFEILLATVYMLASNAKAEDSTVKQLEIRFS